MFTEFSHFWWLFLVFPLMHFVGKKFLQQKKKQIRDPFFEKNANARFPFFSSAPHLFWILKIGLMMIGILFVVLAVWRPQWGQELQTVHKKGLDIVFAVDVSKSMKALDFSQQNQFVSRLDATKWLIKNFMKKRPSDRLGILEFAGESFVASPLTLDHTVFRNFLQNISSDDVGKQGTNLAEAIEVAILRLEIQSTEERGKAIILFSDGEETLSSDAKKMAQLAKDKGIMIFTVGVGSEDGSPIPEMQDRFGNIRYKQWKGETVITKLNPEPLTEIASDANGEYFHAEDASDLQNLSDELDKLPQKILSEKNLSPFSERYFWFALLGLLLFSSGFILNKNIFYSTKS